jgi:hypothetical protein
LVAAVEDGQEPAGVGRSVFGAVLTCFEHRAEPAVLRFKIMERSTDIFVIELRAKPIAVISSPSRLDAELFAATLEPKRVNDCVALVTARAPSAAEAALWREVWQADLNAGNVTDGDRLCVWLIGRDAYGIAPAGVSVHLR